MQLDDVLRKVHALPALPAAVAEVMRCLQDPSVDIDSVAARIARDQGLVTRVLRVANSPFYGLSRPIVSIADAMVILGVRSVGMLVTAAAVANALRPAPAAAFDLKHFWWRAVAAANVARAIAKRAAVDPDRAFLAGLLRDSGILVLACVAPSAYAAVRAECAQRGVCVHEIERACIGLSHAQIGAALAQHWRFGAEIVAAIGAHHDAEPADPLSAVVNAAELCEQIDAGAARSIPASLVRRLCLDDAAVAACLKEMRADQSAAAAMVGN